MITRGNSDSEAAVSTVVLPLFYRWVLLFISATLPDLTVFFYSIYNLKVSPFP